MDKKVSIRGPQIFPERGRLPFLYFAEKEDKKDNPYSYYEPLQSFDVAEGVKG
tara:strand:+ start:8885 stop:9043 length:159 start_codon:yes stop_codon:yes gene_type:complete